MKVATLVSGIGLVGAASGGWIPQNSTAIQHPSEVRAWCHGESLATSARSYLRGLLNSFLGIDEAQSRYARYDLRRRGPQPDTKTVTESLTTVTYTTTSMWTYTDGIYTNAWTTIFNSRMNNYVYDKTSTVTVTEWAPTPAPTTVTVNAKRRRKREDATTTITEYIDTYSDWWYSYVATETAYYPYTTTTELDRDITASSTIWHTITTTTTMTPAVPTITETRGADGMSSTTKSAVGGSIGGVAAVGLLIGGFFLYRRRRKQDEDEKEFGSGPGIEDSVVSDNFDTSSQNGDSGTPPHQNMYAATSPSPATPLMHTQSMRSPESMSSLGPGGHVR